MVLHIPTDRFHLQELNTGDSVQALVNDVHTHLLNEPRSLPPKYFYDEKGSKLFNEICKTKEYYPTYTELDLLKNHATEIVDIVRPKTCVELGAGISAKTEIILERLNYNTGFKTYVTIDVCKEMLIHAAQRLLDTFPHLHIKSLIGDYFPCINSTPEIDAPVLYIFIGSSIGNFSEIESIKLLSEVSKKMKPDDYFLLGLDRVKDKHVLERAYDDGEGATANFNLNVLQVLNDNLGANFNLKNFTHQAIYNEIHEQIEMYLISDISQGINFTLLNKEMHLQKDEKILTEISRKYTKSSIKRMLLNSGLIEAFHFEPENQYFSLVLAKRE